MSEIWQQMSIGLHVKYLYLCPILIKLPRFRQIFEKYSNINFHEILSVGVAFYVEGQTDRHDAANSRFSQFCKGA